MSSVRLSVTLVDHDHVGWKSWKLTARTISPTFSLFLAQRSSTYSQGNQEKFWEENVRSTPTSITLTPVTSGWIELTESHVIFRWRCGRLLIVYFCGASRGNLYDSTAFFFSSVHFRWDEVRWVDWHERSFGLLLDVRLTYIGPERYTTRAFYPRHTVLCVTVSVCLSQVGVHSDGSSWFLAQKLYSTYLTPCFNEIRVSVCK